MNILVFYQKIIIKNQVSSIKTMENQRLHLKAQPLNLKYKPYT